MYSYCRALEERIYAVRLLKTEIYVAGAKIDIDWFLLEVEEATTRDSHAERTGDTFSVHASNGPAIDQKTGD